MAIEQLHRAGVRVIHQVSSQVGKTLCWLPSGPRILLFRAFAELRVTAFHPWYAYVAGVGIIFRLQAKGQEEYAGLVVDEIVKGSPTDRQVGRLHAGVSELIEDAEHLAR